MIDLKLSYAKMTNVSLSGFNASQLLKPLMISIFGPPILL